MASLVPSTRVLLHAATGRLTALAHLLVIGVHREDHLHRLLALLRGTRFIFRHGVVADLDPDSLQRIPALLHQKLHARAMALAERHYERVGNQSSLEESEPSHIFEYPLHGGIRIVRRMKRLLDVP